MFQLTPPIYVVCVALLWVLKKREKKETIFLAKFSIDNMSGPGKWRLWQKLAPQERCVLRRDKGSFENLGGTSSNDVGIIFLPGLNRFTVSESLVV